ncbi:hypothetical protein, partial [Bacillus sp. B25(2016b)]|uniref:hypothetical protein n=1 Tax=Bacillus sp. B25(2016b) TaxID=1868655 RepID=UPI001AD7F4FD
LNPFARLACIRHAASVHPEPGSNSPIKLVCLASKIKIDVSRCLFRSVFKELLSRSFATSLC